MGPRTTGRRQPRARQLSTRVDTPVALSFTGRLRDRAAENAKPACRAYLGRSAIDDYMRCMTASTILEPLAEGSRCSRSSILIPEIAAGCRRRSRRVSYFFAPAVETDGRTMLLLEGLLQALRRGSRCFSSAKRASMLDRRGVSIRISSAISPCVRSGVRWPRHARSSTTAISFCRISGAMSTMIREWWSASSTGIPASCMLPKRSSTTSFRASANWCHSMA